MLILAIDTATPTCSVAVTRNHLLLAETTFTGGRTHATRLMTLVEDTLTLSGVDKMDIDGFAVSKGPGTFTGLRIGISTIKGLAFALNKPIAGVCSLEALAWQFPFASMDIIPMIDARRGEVYYSRYRFDEGRFTKQGDMGVAPPEKAVDGEKSPVLLVGSGVWSYKDVIIGCLGNNAVFAHESQNAIRASSVAMIGLRKIKDNGGVDAETIAPLYLRKSDAQIHRASKKSGPE